MGDAIEKQSRQNNQPQGNDRLLDGKRNVLIDRAGKVGDNQLMLYLMLDSKKVVVQVGVAQVISVETVIQGGFAINTDFDSQELWTLKELQARKLPLYWNENWLREQLALLTTYEAIGQAFGYAPNSISHFAKEKFGIELKSRVDRTKKTQLVQEHLKNQVPLKELAQKHGVAASSISGWVKRWKKGLPL